MPMLKDTLPSIEVGLSVNIIGIVLKGKNGNEALIGPTLSNRID